MDFVLDAALGIRLGDLLVGIAGAWVPDAAVGVGLWFLGSGRLRGWGSASGGLFETVGFSFVCWIVVRIIVWIVIGVIFRFIFRFIVFEFTESGDALFERVLFAFF